MKREAYWLRTPECKGFDQIKDVTNEQWIGKSSNYPTSCINCEHLLLVRGKYDCTHDEYELTMVPYPERISEDEETTPQDVLYVGGNDWPRGNEDYGL